MNYVRLVLELAFISFSGDNNHDACKLIEVVYNTIKNEDSFRDERDFNEKLLQQINDIVIDQEQIQTTFEKCKRLLNYLLHFERNTFMLLHR